MSRAASTTEIRTVHTPLAPAAIGPYSQAVVAGGFVYCSGQIALDPERAELVGSSVGEQTDRVLANLRGVLEAAGSRLDLVVRCTVFLVDMTDFGAMNEAYARAFQGAEPPARSTVAVAALPRGARVEIDCIAKLAR